MVCVRERVPVRTRASLRERECTPFVCMQDCACAVICACTSARGCASACMFAHVCVCACACVCVCAKSRRPMRRRLGTGLRVPQRDSGASFELAPWHTCASRVSSRPAPAPATSAPMLGCVCPGQHDVLVRGRACLWHRTVLVARHSGRNRKCRCARPCYIFLPARTNANALARSRLPHSHRRAPILAFAHALPLALPLSHTHAVACSQCPHAAHTTRGPYCSLADTRDRADRWGSLRCHRLPQAAVGGRHGVPDAVHVRTACTGSVAVGCRSLSALPQQSTLPSAVVCLRHALILPGIRW